MYFRERERMQEICRLPHRGHSAFEEADCHEESPARGVKGSEIKPIVEVVAWIEISKSRRNLRSQEPGKNRLSIQGIEKVSRLRHGTVHRGFGTVDIPQDVEIAEREAILVRV